MELLPRSTREGSEMQKPLDPLGFKQSRYESPNQNWICGQAAEGRPCPLGPDKNGNCRATGQCIPARKDDRWFCTRSEAEGGKCEEGPRPRGECSHPIPPCQPVRSLRRLREGVVWMGGVYDRIAAASVGQWRSAAMAESWRPHQRSRHFSREMQ